MISRRRFLVQAGAAAGLGALSCERTPEAPPATPTPTTPPPKPAALLEAFRWMREENKPGIALRIPESQATRSDPGRGVVELLNESLPLTREVLSELVLVCLESDVIQTHLPPASPGDGLVLFDDDGRAVDGCPFDFRNNRARLPAAIRQLAHGSDRARLKARAEAIRRKTSPSLLAVLDRLADPGTDAKGDAALLQPEAPRIMPLLVLAKLEAKAPERRDILDQMIQYYAFFEPRLPFGIEMRQPPPPCVDPCPPCGMAMVTPAQRSFVRYLTR
jgi:hypothetical protein